MRDRVGHHVYDFFASRSYGILLPCSDAQITACSRFEPDARFERVQHALIVHQSGRPDLVMNDLGEIIAEIDHS